MAQPCLSISLHRLQYSTVQYSTVQYSTVIGAVTYLNKAKAIRESKYTSLNTLKILTWLGGESNRQPL